MSPQLRFSATVSALTMALFALVGMAGGFAGNGVAGGNSAASPWFTVASTILP